MRKIIYIGKHHNSSFDVEVVRKVFFVIGWRLIIGGDDGSQLFSFSISLPYLFSAHFTLRLWSCLDWLPDEGRTTGFYINREMAHVDIWQNPHEHKRGDWSWSWLLPDKIRKV